MEKERELGLRWTQICKKCKVDNHPSRMFHCCFLAFQLVNGGPLILPSLYIVYNPDVKREKEKECYTVLFFYNKKREREREFKIK